MSDESDRGLETNFINFPSLHTKASAEGDVSEGGMREGRMQPGRRGEGLKGDTEESGKKNDLIARVSAEYVIS